MSLPPKAQIELEAKLLILEQIVAHLVADRFAQLPDPLAALDQMAQGYLVERPTLRPGADPAISDLVAAEVSTQAEQILATIREKLADILS